MNIGDLLENYGPWIGAIGTVVTIAALIFAFWAWSRPKNGRLLVAIDDLPLGLPDDHNLEVRFRGDRVDRPRIIQVTLTAGRGADLTPANFDGGGLLLVAHGIDILGAIGGSHGQVEVGGAEDTTRSSDGSVVRLSPCLVKPSEPRTFNLLAVWRKDWVTDSASDGRHITQRLRARMFFLSAEISSTSPTITSPWLELDARLGNFKVVTPEQVAARRTRIVDFLLSLAAVGRI